MKFATIFALVAAAATTAGATYTGETNANRMARGLPPLPPARRSTPVARGSAPKPSKTPGGTNQCNTGNVQCCDEVHDTNDPKIAGLVEILKLLPNSGGVGAQCSDISVADIKQGKCSQKPVCCDHNKWKGLINIGCVPITL